MRIVTKTITMMAFGVLAILTLSLAVNLFNAVSGGQLWLGGVVAGSVTLGAYAIGFAILALAFAGLIYFWKENLK